MYFEVKSHKPSEIFATKSNFLKIVTFYKTYCINFVFYKINVWTWVYNNTSIAQFYLILRMDFLLWLMWSLQQILLKILLHPLDELQCCMRDNKFKLLTRETIACLKIHVQSKYNQVWSMLISNWILHQRPKPPTARLKTQAETVHVCFLLIWDNSTEFILLFCVSAQYTHKHVVYITLRHSLLAIFKWSHKNIFRTFHSVVWTTRA